VAKVNNRATLDVVPELLGQAMAMLPAGFFIAGSEHASGGVVRLVLEGAMVEKDGVHYQMIVTEDQGSRTVTLQKSDVKPVYG
jgi:hypothetical protein